MAPSSVASRPREISLVGTVESVHRNFLHTFSKEQVEAITLLVGRGVQGDAHMGSTVKHRSRVAKDPTQPNLRQVHLIHAELLDEVQRDGFAAYAGDLGENITTRGIPLLDLPVGTTLRVGADALIALTGLRNPCAQINNFSAGLLSKMLGRDDEGGLQRRAGVMAVVMRGGRVTAGDEIVASLPPQPHFPMDMV
jgi:MOSC domain-containing protein YiiM